MSWSLKIWEQVSVLPLQNCVNFCKWENIFETEKYSRIAKRIKSVTSMKSSIKSNTKELWKYNLSLYKPPLLPTKFPHTNETLLGGPRPMAHSCPLLVWEQWNDFRHKHSDFFQLFIRFYWFGFCQSKSGSPGNPKVYPKSVSTVTEGEVQTRYLT